MSRFRSVIAGFAALAATCTLAAPAQAAPTTTTTDLFGLSFLGDISDLAVTDSRVFLSHNNSDAIAVTDAAGTPQTTISGLAGPTGLTLSPDRGTLYVALSSGAAIATYDTTTLEHTRTLPVGAGLCPQTLAVTGRWLWFGEACDPLMGPGRIGRLDLVTGAVRLDVLPVIEGIEGPPKLAPAAGGVLLVSQFGYREGEAVSDVTSYRIGRDGRALRISQLGGPGSAVNWAELALSGDGRTVYLPRREELVAADAVLLGRPTRRLPALAYTFNVGVSPADGRVATVGDPDGDMIYTVSLLGRSGAVTKITDLDAPSTQGRLVWSPDGSRFYFYGTFYGDEGAKRRLYTVTLG